MPDIPYPVASFGTLGVIVGAVLIRVLAAAVIGRRADDEREKHRKRSAWDTVLLVAALVGIGLLWARLLERKATFFGLIGAGLAVALREPLLSIAARIAILLGRIYGVGDRVEINKMTGDVIGVGFFYTRMMEIGNWVGGDQFSGRIIQFPNAEVFGTAVFNYTRGLSYIWDELVLPVTHDSDEKEARRILIEAAEARTRDILGDAREQLERLKKTYFIPHYELKPQVYAKVTSNWLELALRYVVDPRKRRLVAAEISRQVFERVRASGSVRIGSDTATLTLVQQGQQTVAGPR